jgi:trans-aconitate 2-methyltransferase
MSGREWDAATYHRLSDHQHAWGRKVLARLSLRGDETVIDAGCGTGRLTSELAPQLPRGRVLAVDLSENMLREACQNLASSSTCVYICADLAALPFDSVADGVFSSATFHWVRDHDRLFNSLFAALKPGGWLEAQCGGGPNLARVRAHAESLMTRQPHAGFFAGWSPPQFFLEQAPTALRLQRSGFVEINTWIEPAGFAIPDPAEYRLYLARVVYHRHLERIPNQALRDRFLDQMVEQALASEPPLFLDYWRLNIHAKRPILLSGHRKS